MISNNRKISWAEARGLAGHALFHMCGHAETIGFPMGFIGSLADSGLRRGTQCRYPSWHQLAAPLKTLILLRVYYGF